MEIHGYIYKLELIKDLESFKKGEIYIGKHNGRKELYFSGGKIINRIVSKYSKDVFKKEILCGHINSNELLCYMERYYIDFFKSNRNKSGKGLNLTDGGEGIFGFKKTVEQCKKLSEIIKENYKRGLRKTRSGKDVHQYDYETGKYLKTFVNCVEAALDIGKDAKQNCSIAYAARGKCVSAYGYIWSYEKMEVFDKVPGFNNPILQYSLNGDFLKEYKNPLVAAKENNFKNYNILYYYPPEENRKAYGYLWKFKEQVL